MNAALPPHIPPASPGLALDRIGRGLADPVHGAQQVFRQLLAAQSHPGRIQRLPAALLQGLEAAGLGRAMAAVLLSLLDAETGLWLPGDWQDGGAGDWLRFHTGTRTGLALAEAPFAATDLAALTREGRDPASLWATLPCGSDEIPQDGATLLLEVPALAAPGTANAPSTLHLSGPGIDRQRGPQPLRVAGLDLAFWQARADLAEAYPRGVDLMLCCGDTLAAIPRTTRIALPGA